MSMSRKDFVQVAAIISDEMKFAESSEVQVVVKAIAYRLADAFNSANERFDRSRFLTACGVEA